MLVKIIDHKGKERHINAFFVKTVMPKGDDQCEIEVSGAALKIKVNQPADEVALTINAAMPDTQAFLAAAAATEEERQQQQAAAAATGIGIT
ncbi:MAG: hypothetical protein AAFR38_03390 [Planctomycetota bacterium]